MKVVIVGGVAGGASAAARIRRLDERAEIVVFERSGHVSYANCGLPYYIGGEIEQESALTLQTPASFRARFQIDVRVRHEVLAIDRSRKVVSVRNLETGEMAEEAYDKLILSPGARPIAPDLPGIGSSRLFTLRTVEDAARIRRYVEQRRPRTATVIGGEPCKTRRARDDRGKDAPASQPAGRGYGVLCPREIPQGRGAPGAGQRRDGL